MSESNKQLTPKKLLTPQQFADRVGISVNTANCWRNLKRGPRFIKIGKSVRYSEEDIMEWLEQQTREGTSRQNLQTY